MKAEDHNKIIESQMATIFAVADLIESHGNDTGMHLKRLQSYCRVFALRLSENPIYRKKIDNEFINDIYHASVMHDIGKADIPDSVLLKPAKLTPEEFEIVKNHSLLGAMTLEPVHEKYPDNSFISMSISIARSHHEKWDGTGYPDGLSGEAIPMPARIVAFADVYDALRSRLCYKIAFSHEESCSIIAEYAGTQFEPSMVEEFLKIAPEFHAIRKKYEDMI